MMIVHDVNDLLERGEGEGTKAVRVGVEKKGKRESDERKKNKTAASLLLGLLAQTTPFGRVGLPLPEFTLEPARRY